ncbi:hypothetical protein EB73_21765 [Mycobacterium sp. SWH-M3]|nr:hypothetical protein EB73_21765 [Mycobacterium sp. SWH-M3]
MFLLGLAAVLVPLGAGVGAVGAAITAYRAQTTMAVAVVIMAFGIVMILGKASPSDRQNVRPDPCASTPLCRCSRSAPSTA